ARGVPAARRGPRTLHLRPLHARMAGAGQGSRRRRRGSGVTASRYRVALLEPAGRGGICHYTRGLASALARQGVEVVLFTARDLEWNAPATGAAKLPFRIEPLFERWRTSPRAVL